MILSNFVNYPNEPIIPLPGMANNTLMYCFSLQADYSKLLNVCNQRLNFSPLSQTIRYYPIVSTITMVLSKMQRCYTLDKSYQKAGYLSEIGMQIFIPVVECKLNNRNEWVAKRILAFAPYIFVDNPISNMIGREHIGFAKGLGIFNYPSSPDNAHSFDVSVFGFQRYDSQNPQYAGYFPLLNIEKKDSASLKGPSGNWTNHTDAWNVIKNKFEPTPKDPNFIKGLDFYIHELEDLARGEIPMIFLQQYRDISKPEKASYQALNESLSRIHTVHNGWLMNGEYDITFYDMDSYPIKKDLGLFDQTSVNGFWLEVDMIFETGKVIWKAS